ncbi:hypothetical protein AA103196_3100 [Ameyamaea chiangmaiensis NBRC 103196]|uniref:Uncharacterized protein n=1 Tax=Ameyamaea chiangmaiensis TaxID=442969 RepID=A0A850PBM8_9PROT|nr:hypothetical protein [Ameyamaea chiangmaiensis]MBS4074586.1 hypothetical protein [Ameyamaea chiangmaiensis]NVN39342.1 hypothetical protein [Ameyamaea chiangmaiensis]GBQ72577.1 hypothetical protein AA103196_3100 [Ameyamaea chiangmaiensis NBRC 103196]
MAVVAQNLVKGSTLTGDIATIYTAGAGTTVITSVVVANPTSAAVSLTISIQRSGGTTLAIVPARAIASDGTDLAPELARVLTSGDAIQASGNGLNIIIDGYLLS